MPRFVRWLPLWLALGCPADPHVSAEPTASPDPTAADYCETSADMFCRYYIRCGRMAVQTHEACLSTFSEACTQSYQPHYQALEARGEIRLSASGLRECEAHLDEVPCDQQIFDLDGACGAVWEGLAPAGSTCAPGIESFLCDRSSTCVLGLDFCGTCQPTVRDGEPCEDARCGPTSTCVEGTCAPRRLPGETCDEERRCVAGAWCAEGLCEGPTIAALGQSCDQRQRCPYKSACIGGVCVEAALLDEPCGPQAPCASGWCDEGTCAPFKAGGEPCGAGQECHSRACDGTCVPLPGVCFIDE
ncbi:MAG: hypothetical protein EA397_04405 [Deltaproteobacteria bacterium]|nr:MAG: hypothetical protein EA397_04405 [Deltaproteobacteria bacterium]